MNSEVKPSNPNNPFNAYISQIDAISIDELVGETRLGPTLGFQNARQTFESIKEFTDEIRSLDSLWVPGRMIGRANAAFQEIINLMQQIKTFAPSNNQGNPSLRGNLTQQLGNKYAELVEATIPILWFSNYRSSGIKDAQLKTATLLKDIEEQKTKISSVVGESRELLARQKKLSADITITAYGILFKNEAEQHEASAKKWLITTGAIAALTTIAAVYNYVASLDLIKGFSKVPASQAPNLPHCCPNSLLIVSVD